LTLFKKYSNCSPASRFYWALFNRVQKKVAHPGLLDQNSSQTWWHVASESLTDAAMAYVIKPEPATGIWLRDVTLSIIRRHENDWIGPAFRSHAAHPPIGHLETAHLSWAIAIVLDLARNIFTETEQAEITSVLRQRAIPLCLNWVDQCAHMNNWRCVMTAGYAVPAAVLNDKTLLERAARDYQINCHAFQPDGSYAESLQYANYAASALMLTYEVLVRRDSAWADQLSIDAYAPMVKWAAYSHFYNKPLSGWGALPRPRAANFNDSAAIFRPSADLLLHISARSKERNPKLAGIARWLFDTLYIPYVSQSPSDMTSFGFYNTFGFLTPVFLPQAAAAISPQDADFPRTGVFSCGDMFTRDAWNGRTILAVHAPGDVLYASAHQHRDLNSFILVHNQERMLVDPGHSCYRGLIHTAETGTHTHNTCTFRVKLPECSSRQIEQRLPGLRSVHQQTPLEPVPSQGTRLLCEAIDDISVIAADVARSYGAPIEQFSRFWISIGAHVLFIVDFISASEPICTTWHWLLNNRDGNLDLKLLGDRIVARRGDAGMKLFHFAGGNMQGPQYSFVHDCYHPLPAQNGEGRQGSGILLQWEELKYVSQRTSVHAIALDDYGLIGGWHLKRENGVFYVENPTHDCLWQLSINEETQAMTLHEVHSKRTCQILKSADHTWQLLNL